MKKKAIFLSNGYGEDLIAASIARSLMEKTGKEKLAAFPLVGDFGAYDELGIHTVKCAGRLPSGGFWLQKPSYLVRDLMAGLIGNFMAQARMLSSLKDEYTHAVCVGDVFLLIMAGMFLKKKAYFVATAKSDRIRPHGLIERLIMKRWAREVLTRDEETAAGLKAKGIKALFRGNALIDAFPALDKGLVSGENGIIIGVLPGSRDEAYANISLIISMLKKAIDSGMRKDISLYFAVSGVLDPAFVSAAAERAGLAVFDAPGGHAARYGDTGFYFKKGIFAELIKKSRMIIGLAGTANEQCAGWGLPVIAFKGRGPQTTEKRFLEQKKLLGDSLVLVKTAGELSSAVNGLLGDPGELERLRKYGLNRGGGPGAGAGIASYLQERMEAGE